LVDFTYEKVAFASPDVALSTKGEKYAFNDATIGSNSRWTLLMRPLFFSAALILVASSNVFPRDQDFHFSTFERAFAWSRDVKTKIITKKFHRYLVRAKTDSGIT
jgi:hypothetical protein